MHILVMEDDRAIAQDMVKLLQDNNHVVENVYDGDAGLERARQGDFQLIIVDRMMPGRDGLSVVKTLRRENITTPAIFLSALTSVEDRVEGLQSGGDDYIGKPYESAELLARIEAIARRGKQHSAETKLSVGNLELDRLTRKVHRAGQEILLQPREFCLLEYLMKNAGQVVTRTMLLEHVWGINFDPQTNVIDVHVSRLRTKIDRSFDSPMLHTVRGSGYSLRAAL